MSSQLATLHDQILELEQELRTAEEAYAQASAALAGNPANSDAQDSAKRTSTRVADLRGDLKVLRDARAVAEINEKSAEAEARKQEAVAQLHRAEQLANDRVTAGKAIDKALADLQQAAKQWLAVNNDMTLAVVDFYKLAAPNHPHLREHYFGIGGDLVNIGGNAITCQIEEALRGINMHGHLAFNFVRSYHDEPELVARDAENFSRKLLSRMSGFAIQEGLEVEA